VWRASITTVLTQPTRSPRWRRAYLWKPCGNHRPTTVDIYRIVLSSISSIRMNIQVNCGSQPPYFAEISGWHRKVAGGNTRWLTNTETEMAMTQCLENLLGQSAWGWWRCPMPGCNSMLDVRCYNPSSRKTCDGRTSNCNPALHTYLTSRDTQHSSMISYLVHLAVARTKECEEHGLILWKSGHVRILS
jgi:hypothetical protein